MRKLLFMCLALTLLGYIPSFGKVYLVSVGIADYPGQNLDLHVSTEDAKAIGKIYNATRDAEVHVLTNIEATQGALLSTMHTVFSKADTNDMVMLFFSGHGDKGSLICYDGLLSYRHIFQMFKGCPASQKVIIADACYTGRMRKEKEMSTDSVSQDVMFFLSSRTNELSQETRYKNSLFTIFLERGLRGGADRNKDKQITARELFDFVHVGVIDASKGRQHPVMWGKFDDDMSLIKW